MKVLHCITGLNTGGAETMLCKLVSRLPERGVECRVVSLLPPGPLAGELAAMGVRVDSLGMSRGVPSLGALWKLSGIIRSWRPDVVQTWLYHADLLGLLAARLAGHSAVAWNIRCSYMDLSRYGWTTSLVLKLCSWLSPLPTVVLANSDEARRFHERLGYRARRFEVIPNGFDTDRFSPDAEARERLRRELGLAPDALLVGLVARFDPMKDHAGFLRAAAELRSLHPGVRFVLCGDGISWENRELAEFVRKEALEDSVFLLGRRSDIPSLTAALDVAVCCSIGESFPNVVGEALACGVPCVVTDVGDSARIVGPAGVVVEPGNPSGLCRGIFRLLELGNDERQAMGALGRERVVSLFSLEKVAGLYYDLYKDMVGKAG
ncbi:glycosyltransferase family 4 protein [Salidesulfovibrio onnuriiensis]|uniref:glycosyltransferase family 4 protein n=1 Tax=Salidesulfovibrio onnuriiensis TaxID=2583823 RepID=UPI0011CADC1F|nr:glycosyltransferase [Salidesulfovibrio onnuriiensis]